MNTPTISCTFVVSSSQAVGTRRGAHLKNNVVRGVSEEGDPCTKPTRAIVYREYFVSYSPSTLNEWYILEKLSRKRKLRSMMQIM